MSTNKRPMSNVHQKQQIFLGTSLVPKGRMRAEQLSKSAQALVNYISKKEKLTKDIKNARIAEDFDKAAALIAEKSMLRMQPIELRIAFIPFVRSEKKHKLLNSKYETPSEHYNRDMIAHNEKVVDKIEEISRNYYKAQKDGYNGKVIDIHHNYKNTSKVTGTKKNS